MNESNDAFPSETTATSTGGEAGAIGYEYQINVTVWLALDLMVRRGWCRSIEVEPASDEDIATQLHVPNDNVTVELGIAAGTIDLEIQIKGRSTGQWTTSTFREVVSRTATPPVSTTAEKKKGPPPRPSPLERLTQQSSTQYLFVTNADVDSSLRPFVINGIGARSTAQALPWVTTLEIGDGVAERIAIRPQINSDYLDLAIDKLLGSVGVPAQSRCECRRALVEEIRARLLKKTVKTFSNETLSQIIQTHGGEPPTDSKIVRPQNFEQMQGRLERDRALLLTGPPGTGKTLVSLELARLFRQGDESHEIIHVLQGPVEIRQQWEREGNQLFIVEDPWGRYKAGEDADSWHKELSSLFAELSKRPGKRIIVTTRAGLLTGVGGGKLAYELQRAQVSLQSEDYSKIQRREILHRALAGSQPSQRAWLSQHEERVLEALPEPMALNQLGTRVAGAKDVKVLNVQELIGACAQEALGSQFAGEIKGRGGDAVDAAIVLWAWHGIKGGLREDTVSDLLTNLRKGGLTDPPDVRKLLQWTEKSEWWPRHERGWRVHPTLLEGLDNLAGSEPGSTNRLLGALVAGLHRNGRTDQALRLHIQVRSRLADLDGDVELALGQHALERFAHGNENEASHAYYDVQHYLHIAHPVAKLLTLLKPQGESMMGPIWTPAQLDADTFAELSTSTYARAAALRFIKFVIARDAFTAYDGVKLMSFLRSFGWDFTEECLTLALEDLRGLTSYSCKTLVESGLCGDKPAYETVFNAALDALAEMECEDNAQGDSSRAADQWEISPASVEHWGEQRSDDCYRVVSSLKAAMELCRNREGWLRLAASPRVNELVKYWVEILEPGASLDEIKEIASVCGTKDRETFWKAAAQSGRSEMVETILKDFPVAPVEKAQKCLDALLRLIAPTEYSLVIVPILKALPWPRRSQFAVSRPHRIRDEHERHWWDDCFTDDEREALLCCAAIKEYKALPATVSSSAVECLEVLAQSAENIQALRALTVLAKMGRPNPIGALRLWQSTEGKVRRDALLAAISTQLPCVKEWLQAALIDPEARVREIALRNMAEGADEHLRAELLKLNQDPSALVRKALAEVIGERAWKDGAPALLHLLGDQLDFADYGDRGERLGFEVARAAATSLGKLKPLVQTTIDKALDFLSQRPAKGSHQHDYKVHALLLDALAGESDPKILRYLITTLEDTWNVAAWGHSYYPLRSAAAWALYKHLENRPRDRELVAPSAIASAANDFNPSLAGPALIVLGMLGCRAAGELSALPNAPSFTLERLLLVWLFVPPEAASERETLRAAIGITHAAADLLPLLESQSPMTEKTWAQFLSQHRDCAQWLKSLDDGEDVERLLFAALTNGLSKTTMDELLKTALAPVVDPTKTDSTDLIYPPIGNIVH